MKTNKDYYDLRFSSEELLMIDTALSNAGVSEMDLRETKTQKFCDKGGFFEGCVMEGIEYHKESK